MLIEIRVSHAVEESKLNLIKNMNLSAIEVDLSDLHAKGYDDDVLRERLIEQDDRKKWLHSPKIDGIREDALMTTIYRNCSLRTVSEEYLSLVCPAEGKRIVYYDCYWCEYAFSDKVRPVREIWCGYKDIIKDYDSLQRCLKRKAISRSISYK